MADAVIDWTGLPLLGLVLFGAAILGASVLRGFSGFGFALAAVPLVAMLMAPARAVTIVVLVQAIMGGRDVWQQRALVDRPGLYRLAAGALVGTPFGVAGLLLLDATTTRLLIAAIVSIGVVLLLRPQRPHAQARLGLALPSGIVAGLFGGLAAMPGPPAIAYYLSGPTAPATVRASLLVFFFVTSLLALPGLILGDLVDRESLLLALVALPLLLGGTAIGTHLFKRAPARFYRPVALACLAAMALSSGLRGVLDLLG